MPRGGTESGVSASGVDFTALDELFIETRDAKREDVGAMANIFIKSFKDDRTARLLYSRDGVWPVVVEMLREYLQDDYTHVRVAWDEYTDTIVAWSSISLVTSVEEDHFKSSDSTVWAGRQLLLRESRTRSALPLHQLHLDDIRRHHLVAQLQSRNREGQNRHVDEQHLVINTIAIHPDVFEDEIPELAYKLIDDARDLAQSEDLPLWAQFPKNSLGDLDKIFEEIGFGQVGDFELNLNWYASEQYRRERNWGFQKWRQWLLRTGDWERGRRY